MSEHFEQETAVEPQGAGVYGVGFSRDWFVHAGPNGGIVAAVLLRACNAEVGDPNRSPRTLTVHYLGPPAEGPAEVRVRTERSGKGISFVSAKLLQQGEPKAIALVAYGTPRAEKVAWSARPLPAMAPPEQCAELRHALEEAPNIHHRWETRWALGTLHEAGPTEASVSGGWIRASVPTPVDHVLVAAMADAWLPPVLARPGIPLLSVPTVEPTVHFRDTTTLPQIGPADWFACTFRTDVAQEGFLEEDGLIWAADGRLVAMSRQLAVVVERRSFTCAAPRTSPTSPTSPRSGTPPSARAPQASAPPAPVTRSIPMRCRSHPPPPSWWWRTSRPPRSSTCRRCEC